MAITINHPFVSAKVDGSDATLVRPSNWNASHDLKMATSRIIGRLTAGPGLAEELPITSYMAGLLNTADGAALAAVLGLPTTGDAVLTFKTVAASGWVLMNDGSIGDAASGGTTRANVDTQALFILFYNNVNDTNAPLQTQAGGATTRGAQGAAATAFSNHCRMVLPKQLGRAIIIGGFGAGLSGRALGGIGGEESHQLLPAEVPDHTHTVTPSGTVNNTDINHTHQQGGTFTSSGHSVDHSHTQQGTFTSAASNQSLNHAHGSDAINAASTFTFSPGAGQAAANRSAATINAVDLTGHSHNVTISGQTGGTSGNHTHTVTLSGGTGFMDQSNPHGHTFTGSLTTTSGAGFGWGSHNNMQPFTAWNVMVKL
jgi:microcystin-dependent protein